MEVTQLHHLLQRRRLVQLALPVVAQNRLQHVVRLHLLAVRLILGVQRADGCLVVVAVQQCRQVRVRGRGGDARRELLLVLLVVDQLGIIREDSTHRREVLDAAVHRRAEGEVDGWLGREGEDLCVRRRARGDVAEVEAVGTLEVAVHSTHAHQVASVLLQHLQIVWGCGL